MELESKEVSETGDAGVAGVAEVDVTPSDSVDVHSDELTAVSAAAEAVVTATESQPPVTADDDVEHVESRQLPQQDVREKDGTRLCVVMDDAEVVVAESGVKPSMAVMTDGVVCAVDDDADAELKAEGTSDEDDLRNNKQSGQDDKSAVGNNRVLSKETQPDVGVDSSADQNPANSTNSTQRIDWDSVGKPKQKLTVSEDAEFSQVFNKVVTQRDSVEADDSVQVTAQRSYSSLTDLSSSETCVTSAGECNSSQLSASKTQSNDGNTKPSTCSGVSSVAIEIKPHGEGTKSSSPDEQSPAVTKLIKPCDEDMKRSSPAKESPVVTATKPHSEDTKLSSPGKVPSAVSKTKPLSEDTTPSSPGKEPPAVPKAKPHTKESFTVTRTKLDSEDTRPSSPGKESPAATKIKPHSEDTTPSSPGKESSTVTTTKAHSEDTTPSSPGKESSTVTTIKPHSEDTILSSPGKEPPAVPKTKPHTKDSFTVTRTKPDSEDTRPSSPGKESSPVTMTKPSGENTRSLSAGKRPPTVTKTKPRGEDMSPSSQGKEFSATTTTKQHDEGISVKPQVDDVSIDHTKKKESLEAYKANTADSSSRELDACSKGAADGTQSVSSHDDKVKTCSSSTSVSKVVPTKKPSLTKAKDQRAVDRPVTGDSDHQMSVPTRITSPSDSGASLDISTSDRQSGQKVTCNTASMSELKEDAGDSVTEAGASSSSKPSANTDVKSAPSQQRLIQMKSTAKVQPAEAKTEGPAWLLAAQHKKKQWNEGRVEELDKKPLKTVSSVDDEVHCSISLPQLM